MIASMNWPEAFAASIVALCATSILVTLMKWLLNGGERNK